MPAAVSKVARLAGAVTVAGAACVGYGILVERDWYRLRRERVEALDPGQAPLTVLHLSDLHMTASDARRVAFLERLAAEPVDLVVLTGDMLGEPAGLGPVLEALGRFRPRLGAVAVLGSNDYWAPRFRNPLTYFMGPSSRRGRSSPATPGASSSRAWRRGAGRCCPTAAASSATSSWPAWTTPTSAATTPPPPSPPTGTRARACASGWCTAPTGRALDAFEGNGYELVLAGHTHGGQVRLPGVGALVTNCDLPRDRVRGLSRWGSSWLHVSAGLGTSKYAPFRFACRPEASLLTVVSRA